LADSIPELKLRLWVDERERWLASHPEPRTAEQVAEYWKLFPDRLQEWLDAGHGSCVLARPPIRILVEQALRHFDGRRYELGEFVVMPNHVHALVTPLPGNELSEILHSWKSYTSHEINQRLGESGPRWQKETFDHIVRSPAQMDRIEQYIRDNPKPKGRRGEA
jgi:REP element-mobilizing transposase RayT